MSYYEKLVFAAYIITHSESLEGCRENVCVDIWDAACRFSINGIFGTPYIGEA
jgi:hypothetical protein